MPKLMFILSDSGPLASIAVFLMWSRMWYNRLHVITWRYFWKRLVLSLNNEGLAFHDFRLLLNLMIHFNLTDQCYEVLRLI